MKTNAGGRLKHLFLVPLLGCVLQTMAVAQKTEPRQSVPMPPQVPMFTAAELAAKVPPAKSGDVNSRDAILAAIYDVISGPAGGGAWEPLPFLFFPHARFTPVA